MYRPRYSALESSNEAYAEDLRQKLYQGRKRQVRSAIILILGFIAVSIIFRAYNFITGGITGGKSTTQNFAKKESFGLFIDIPNDTWKQKKAESKKAVKLQSKMIATTSNMLSESGANMDETKWWEQNWLPNFECDNQLFIGGKWICEPIRIVDLADQTKRVKGKKKKKKQRGRRGCLIYISGGNDMEFGHQFLAFVEARMQQLHENQPGVDLSLCEVHIFNHFITDPTLLANNMQQQGKGIHIHPFGFRPENKGSMGAPGNFKTFKEAVKELGHNGKSLSILSLDCEGCEWDLYRDILSSGLTIQQILVQMHGTPFIANRFFSTMHNAGYAIYRREQVGVGVYDYSFLKLSPSYFGFKFPRLFLRPASNGLGQ